MKNYIKKLFILLMLVSYTLPTLASSATFNINKFEIQKPDDCDDCHEHSNCCDEDSCEAHCSNCCNIILKLNSTEIHLDYSKPILQTAYNPLISSPYLKNLIRPPIK